MGKVISICSNKGGIAKTTAATTLAEALANLGFLVLLIDNDAQCDASKRFYDLAFLKEKDTLYDAICDDTPPPIEACIYPTKLDNLALLPNSPETSVLEMDLVQEGRQAKSQLLFRDRIRPYATQHFDFILIDNQPALNIFNYMSMAASDYVIIPVECGSQDSIDAMQRTIQLMAKVQATINPELQLLRVLVSWVEKRLQVGRMLLKNLRKDLGEECLFQTTIPTNTDVQQAEKVRKTVLSYNNGCAATKAYRALAKEIVAILGLPLPKTK